MSTSTFPRWALVEIFGHVRYAGLVSEVTIAGEGFLQIQVPDETDGFVDEKTYSPKAVFSMYGCPEATIRGAVKAERERREAEERRSQQYRLGAAGSEAWREEESEQGDEEESPL